MADKAKSRLQAIGEQLGGGESRAMPAIKEIAAKSTGPRAKDKVIIITGNSYGSLSIGFPLTYKTIGANSVMGIGRATAHQFAQNGAKAVYLCDYDGSYLEAHKHEIGSLYPEVDIHTRRFDASDEEAIKEVVGHAIQTYGRLDVFFANAGITGPHQGFRDIDAENFMQVLKVNTLG